MTSVADALFQKAKEVDAIFPSESYDKEYRAAIGALANDFKLTGVASIALPDYDRARLSRNYPGLLRRTEKALVRAARANGFSCDPYIHRTEYDNTGEKINLILVAKDLGVAHEYGKRNAAPKLPDLID